MSDSTKRITGIVVDDEPDIVDVFSEMLEDRGIEVIGKGGNGKEAIDLYFANNPDIVFVDMMMPDGSGFYAIKKIRAKDSKAVIIAVTADVTSLTEEKLKKLKVNGIVYKPIDMDNLMEIVKISQISKISK
ncbi:response regulator [Nitrosopumilus maritimus]|uniref:Response regulator receiver protein n=1 Tax=Nitrosopumilus maritimus (strain SCM1) TaxID=436308 RepID=A9A5E9_NITMS|nr:response regulator [Nitrosopumilus maritimus]ABX12348.1 response regulator receiver protein [Nitrosopumilus maritimus SCM1]